MWTSTNVEDGTMSKIDRRRFLKCSLAAAGGAMLPQILPGGSLLNLSQNASASPTQAGLSHVEARYYKKLDHKEIECELCPRKCKVGDRERGYCGCRENQNGIYSLMIFLQEMWLRMLYKPGADQLPILILSP